MFSNLTIEQSCMAKAIVLGLTIYTGKFVTEEETHVGTVIVDVMSCVCSTLPVWAKLNTDGSCNCKGNPGPYG